MLELAVAAVIIAIIVCGAWIWHTKIVDVQQQHHDRYIKAVNQLVEDVCDLNHVINTTVTKVDQLGEQTNDVTLNFLDLAKKLDEEAAVKLQDQITELNTRLSTQELAIINRGKTASLIK